MKVEGRYFKESQNEQFYSVEIKDLGIYTQGETAEDCLDMAKDAIELTVSKEGFSVEIIPSKKGRFFVRSNNSSVLIGAILKAQRIEHGLSAKEVAELMGEKSETGYRRYERGEVSIGIEKLDEIFRAMSIEPCLKIS